MLKVRWVGYGDDWPEGQRLCCDCNEVKPTDAFHKNVNCKGGYNSVCKACRVLISKAQHQATPKEKRLFNGAKSRAQIKGRDFNIELSDIVIPDTCPVLNIPMERPSLDRIDSAKGYVKGNVRVISTRANVLKNNATVAELELVLADLKRVCEVL